MKKIFWVLVVLCFSFIWYSYGLYSDQCSWWKVYRSEWVCWNCNSCDWVMYWNTGIIGCDVVWYKKCCPAWSIVITVNGKEKCKHCDSLTQAEIGSANTENCTLWCDAWHVYELENWAPACCPWILDESGHCQESLSQYWIDISTECLLNWQCGLNVYKVLWIRKSNENPTVMWFFQDITLATTTAALWTVIIVIIIISWLFFAFASITWKDTKRAKTMLIDAFIWLLLVMWSYTIIRLIQFIATAWS